MLARAIPPLLLAVLVAADAAPAAAAQRPKPSAKELRKTYPLGKPGLVDDGTRRADLGTDRSGPSRELMLLAVLGAGGLVLRRRVGSAAPRSMPVAASVALPEPVPLPAPQPTPPARKRRRPPWPPETADRWQCEIAWHKGIRRARFEAVARSPDDAVKRVVGCSAPLSGELGADPDPEPDIVVYRVRAQRLAEAAEAAGWERCGTGRRWWSARFSWPGPGDPPDLEVDT